MTGQDCNVTVELRRVCALQNRSVRVKWITKVRNVPSQIQLATITNRLINQSIDRPQSKKKIIIIIISSDSHC